MALWFDLKVNNETIGFFEAQRISGKATADSVNTYDVEVSVYDTRYATLTIEHRYGDGAWELVRKALHELQMQGYPQ